MMGKVGDLINIGKFERFVVDYVRKYGIEEEFFCEFEERCMGEFGKVVVVGVGFVGFIVVGEFVKMGYKVIIFEVFYKFGGVFVYGIFEFCFLKEIFD